MPPITVAALEARLDAYERHLNELGLTVGEIRQAQRDATELVAKSAKEARELIQREAAAQREIIKAEGDRMTQGMLEQTEHILAVSQSLVRLQQQVSKYAAGGSLAGAVVLFIAVRALGF
jgi:1-aminocyclopropane-1-carboxylate deaminase/D-cysteine desulfhydrase-like pyridoxal-dependent ACC family enzyme